MHRNQALSWQSELVERYGQLRKRTLSLAKQHGWPLRKNYSSQRVLQLQHVDALGHPVYYTLHNVEAARGTRTLALQGRGSLPVSLSGSSPVMAGRLGLWDGGRVLESHQEFSGAGSGKILHKNNLAAVNNHTTHLAGTLAGRGVDPDARGMASEAQLAVWDYTNDLAELAVAAPDLLISNHAYGPVAGWVYNDSRPGTNHDLKWEWWGTPSISTTEDYLFGFYSTTVQDLDRLAYNNPFFLMVRSADNKRSETGPPAGTPYFLKNSQTQSTIARSRNDSYDVIPADATAKNVLTVGAAQVSYTNQGEPILLGSTAFSGWGPTDDGRIKPDLLGIGSDVLSSIATAPTDYGIYSGTSMASANVAGSLFLLQELYATRQRAAGLPASGQFMRAATLKGLVLHTADRPNPAAGPDYRQGWGLLNTEAAARLLLNEEKAHLVLQQGLAAGTTFTQQIVAQGNEPLIVTLSWTDPEGKATSVGASALNNRTPKLVNDLDLRLSDGANTYFPFVLNPAIPARVASRGDNSRDNVEQVYIVNPIPRKTYTLTVSHKGSMMYSSQPFSVVVSGLQRINCQLTASILPTGDTMLCEGKNVELRASTTTADNQYQWLRNGNIETTANSYTYQATKAGSYTLRITNKDGCSATAKPVQVEEATVSLTPSGSQWLCEEDKPILLTAHPSPGQTDITYSWLLNGTVLASESASTLSVRQPGRYQVRVMLGNCLARSTDISVLATSVNNLDLTPEEPRLRLPQGATLTLKAQQDTSYQYQWYRNGNPLLNAREYKLSVAQGGIYKVQATQHGCVGWSTDRLVETSILTAVPADPMGQFMIYPNPAENALTIRYVNAVSAQVEVSIVDLQGHVQQAPLRLKAQHRVVEGYVSIEYLPAGTYVLQLVDGGATQTARFIKK